VGAPPPLPFFSVIVPTRGAAGLPALLDALRAQTLGREHFETLVVADGVEPDAAARAALEALGAKLVRLDRRGGPGAARNAAAAVAAGEVLAFTEDDCTLALDWLDRARARFLADPTIDVLEGVTLKPGGRPVRRLGEDGALHLPTNLFVRRALFARVGGYCETFFDAANGVYFREDADLGFTLEAAGARIVIADEVRVTHPEEHARWLDPLRWASRYEMDALLAARHPQHFRERIEIHRLGPFRVRRPIVRASMAYLVALFAALAMAALGHVGMALVFLGFALIAFLPIWAKWRFDLVRLPIYLFVPFALIAALMRGSSRVRAMGDVRG
jgi:glycosyltransferase involved in cell wall biosynthesis